MVRCSNCGNEVAEGKKFCRNCGAPMAAASEEATTWRLPPNTAPTPDPPRSTMPVAANQAPPPPQTANPVYVPPQADYYAPPLPPVPYQPAAAQGGQSHITLGDWLSGGWRVYKENWLLMSLASVLGGAISLGTAFIMAGPLLMGMFRMAFKTMRGERPQLGDMFNFEGRFLQAFLAFLIAGAIYFGLFIGNNAGLFAVLKFLVLPFLTMMLALAMPMILERRIDVVNAINEVGRLIFSRDALMWWVVGLVFATIMVGGGVVGCGVGFFITLPWMISSAAVAYRDVFDIDDPNRTLH